EAKRGCRVLRDLRKSFGCPWGRGKGSSAKRIFQDAKAGRNLLLLLLIVVARAAYLILVGGDFMEFRAWVPILPLAFLLLAYLTWYQLGAHLFRRPTLVAGLVVTVLTAASVHHALKFRGLTEDRTLDSIETLATFYGVYPDRKWDRIGNALGTQLQSLDVRIALTAVGAIPYYSRIPTTDMLGLTDREVARHGKPAPADYPRPGHQRHARISYLIEQRVNLVIGHPTLAWRGLLASPQARRYIESWFPIAVPYGQEPFVNPVMVLMPVTRERGLLMWYLTPSPELDQVIRQNGWELRRTDLVLPVEEGR
ncbi:MAG: hypothetical protein ABIK62_07210, partial [candidate division WOR-3 bacterium]